MSLLPLETSRSFLSMRCIIMLKCQIYYSVTAEEERHFRTCPYYMDITTTLLSALLFSYCVSVVTLILSVSANSPLMIQENLKSIAIRCTNFSSFLIIKHCLLYSILVVGNFIYRHQCKKSLWRCSIMTGWIGT